MKVHYSGKLPVQVPLLAEYGLPVDVQAGATLDIPTPAAKRLIRSNDFWSQAKTSPKAKKKTEASDPEPTTTEDDGA
jgi:hypothetical protein